MKFSQVRKIAPVLVLVVMLLSLTGCPKDSYTTASKASKDIAFALDEMQNKVIVPDFKAGIITASEARSLSDYVLRGTQADDLFIKNLQTLKNTGSGPTPSVEVINIWVTQLAGNLTDPAALTVFHVSNVDTQARLAIYQQSILTAVSLIQSLEVGLSKGK